MAEVGLRERKKLETARRITETALRMFLERGYDEVSVAEIAAEIDVSKMTVFNYFSRKEDIVLAGPARHAEDTSRVVRERAPGESIVGALRRAYLEGLSQHAPEVGLSAELAAVVHMIMTTPVLAGSYREMARHGEEKLAQTLAAETGAAPDDLTPSIAAAQIVSAWRVLVESNFRRVAGGEDPEQVFASAHAAAIPAFEILESGLGDYGSAATPSGPGAHGAAADASG